MTTQSSEQGRAPLAPQVNRARMERLREGDRSLMRRPVNVGDAERLASVLGGGALAVFGLARRSLGGLVAAFAGGALVYRGVSGHCPAYQTLGINCERTRERGPQNSVRARHGVRVEQSMMIMAPREELYRFWRNFSNLPRIMRHLQSVEMTSPGRSHWVVRGPAGIRVEWDAEIITEKENELIGWRSVDGSEIDVAGSVHFLSGPEGRGTMLTVNLKYDPPAGKLGAALAWALGGSPAQQIREDLRRFKSFMETGRVPTAARLPHES